MSHSEMVERVAKALRRADAENGSEVTGSSQGHGNYYHYLAVATIAAMREPTDAMLSAGDSMMPQIAKGQDITTGYDALQEAWPAMIDAALSDETMTAPTEPKPTTGT